MEVDEGERVGQAHAPDPVARPVEPLNAAPVSVTGNEAQVDVDPDSIALVVIRGVPEGARLSTGARDDDGSWSISPLDLSSVVIHLPTDEPIGTGVEGELDITGIAFTDEGELVAISETVPLADYVATPAAGAVEPGGLEPPDPRQGPEAASQPAFIPLGVDAGAWADEPFDALVVRDLPPGARLSVGSYDPSIDGWVLKPQDLPTLAVAPPEGQGTDFTLTLMGVALRSGAGNAARVLARLPVHMR
ncbi:MAG: hypothetical protein AAF637_11690 [Pseudomonadota bacterium]